MDGTDDAPHYYALVYFTATGEIIDEIPMSTLPQWLQQINQDGTWSITSKVASKRQLGDPTNALMSKRQMRGATDPWRFSVAICWGLGDQVGDYICQAGPLISRRGVSEADRTMQFGGAGLWGLLRMIMQINSGSTVGTPFTAAMDSTYVGTLRDIAIQILANGKARQSMPLIIPTVSGTGTDTRTFNVFDLASGGQRLQEISQVMGGSDILLKPSFLDSGHIQHTALVGSPTLPGSGNPLVFDYPGNVVSIVTSEDGSAMRTKTYERGNGSAYATLFAQSADKTGKVANGWPSLEIADSGHMDVTDQPTLQGWADGTQALNSTPVETWAVVAKMDDADYPFGSYDPGPTAIYNVQDHYWLEDGAYSQNKLLGLSAGSGLNEIVHIVLNGGL
jgi:hypothetical protein